MKVKIIAFILCMITLMGVFASCTATAGKDTTEWTEFPLYSPYNLFIGGETATTIYPTSSSKTIRLNQCIISNITYTLESSDTKPDKVLESDLYQYHDKYFWVDVKVNWSDFEVGTTEFVDKTRVYYKATGENIVNGNKADITVKKVRTITFTHHLKMDYAKKGIDKDYKLQYFISGVANGGEPTGVKRPDFYNWEEVKEAIPELYKRYGNGETYAHAHYDVDLPDLDYEYVDAALYTGVLYNKESVKTYKNTWWEIVLGPVDID